MIGNQRQVDRQRLGSPPESLGQIVGQRGVQSLFQRVVFRQRDHQRVEHGLLAWCVGQVSAGSVDGTDSAGCEEQDVQQERRPTFVAMILKSDMLLDHVRCTAVDFVAGNRILVLP